MSQIDEIDNPYIPGFEEYIHQKTIDGSSCTYDIVPESEGRVRRKCSMDEIAILRTVRINDTATEKQLAYHLGKSEDEMKALISTLMKDGILERCTVNGIDSWYPLT